MKYIFACACSLLLMSATAQRPDKIYGSARQNKPVSYYKQQSAAWKKWLGDHPQDADAWYNYYYANRSLKFLDTADHLSDAEKQKNIDRLVEDMGKQVPESYEYNLCRYMIRSFDPAARPYLDKAVALGPERTEHLDFMINHGELERNLKNRSLYSKKKFEAGLFSGGVINYNYNVMAGLERNAILITCGDNDTYPAWLLQAQGFRTDITVINLSLLLLDDYRYKLFAELGIDKHVFEGDDNASKTEEDHERYRNKVIAHIAANKKGYPVYVALTASGDEPYVKRVEQDLYLTGLAYQYSKKPLDNMALLKKNVEQLYALDYLDKTFYRDLSPDIVKIINGNYLVPLLKLFDHYRLSGESQKEDWVRAKLLAISKETENEEEVKKRVAQQ